ncbi:unnamed protein product [Brachionus calyciflorus]|uniref:Uncharacterized protein n=1 Tax=Brachionus calyciflorus TaxID=104777 RepID=A0A814HL38_9BILA|nr:unnamed protein product [Brachionus calyciflorus]
MSSEPWKKSTDFGRSFFLFDNLFHQKNLKVPQIINLEAKLDEVKKGLENIQNDLKQFVTKDDLRVYATKADLEKLATKDDLKNLLTKTDFKEFITNNVFCLF